MIKREGKLDECDNHQLIQIERCEGKKILVICTPNDSEMFVKIALEVLAGPTYEIETIYDMPIVALPKMEPLEKPQPKCYGRKQSKNLSRWR